MDAQLREWVYNTRHSKARETVHRERNEIKVCPLCDHNIEDRKIAVYSEIFRQLYDIYTWCGMNRRHEFKMKEIRHLLDQAGYTRFNDLIQCSNGILYRPVREGKAALRGEYGMNMGRAKEFFQGKRTVHLQISMDQITGEWKVLKEAFIKDIPPLAKLIDEKGFYDYNQLI